MMPRQLAKYLGSHGLEKNWTLVGTERTNFPMAVVIPALAELRHLPETLAALAANPAEYLEQTLVAVVVNQRENATVDSKQENRETLAWLATSPFPRLNLAVVDAASAGLEFSGRDGVGLARKIGFDLSLERLDWNCRPVLISLDADTLVDEHYLAAIWQHFQRSGNGGAVIPFRHQQGDDPEQERAVRHYELYLRSYLYGLNLAGSPYAYHTIGSAFCCLAGAYVAGGGMNRRLAAEDFYFLQRLAKTSRVDCLRGTVVAPAARFSHRVPFGTGPTLRQQVEDRSCSYRFIGRTEFELLKDWLVMVRLYWDRPGEELLGLAEERSRPLADFLTELGFLPVWRKLQNNYSSPEQRLASFHVWFDALRTRQLLTRCAGKDDRDPVTVVGELLAWGGQSGPENLVQQLRLLETLQGVNIPEE